MSLCLGPSVRSLVKVFLRWTLEGCWPSFFLFDRIIRALHLFNIFPRCVFLSIYFNKCKRHLVSSVGLYFTIPPIFIPPHCSVCKIQTRRWEVRVAPPRTPPLRDGDNAPTEPELGACAWVNVGVADGHLWRCYAASEGI